MATEDDQRTPESPPHGDQDRLAAEETPSVIQLHPGAAEAYCRLATDLHQAIEGDDGEDVRTELRKLIDLADFIPVDGLGKFQLEVHGSLAALLALRGAQNAKPPQFWLRGFL
jgi:hypothetical protein